jgi:hypothetical protein
MDDDRTRNLYQQQVNINLNRQIEAQARALGGYSSSVPPLASGTLPEGMAGAMRQLVKERDEAVQLVKEWQAAMEAWRDLALALRDEIKACQNYESHKFGKDADAIDHHRRSKEDDVRASKGLETRYAPSEKGKL